MILVTMLHIAGIAAIPAIAVFIMSVRGRPRRQPARNHRRHCMCFQCEYGDCSRRKS